jgi:hypothetical protein
MPQDKLYALTIHIRVKKGQQKGILIGQCIEYPAVIVQGKTLFDIKREMLDGLEGYFKAFPERVEGLKERDGVLVENQEQKNQIDQRIQSQEDQMIRTQAILDSQNQIGEQWQEMEISTPIPVAR